MRKEIQLGDRRVGVHQPTYIVGEIGINHNGSLKLAKQLIQVAKDAGLDAVKFQKRTPELCVPEEQRDKMRETPWGYLSYIDYRHKVEFGKQEYQEIAQYCHRVGIDWFVSVWDIPSVDFIENFDPICIKVPSAMLLNRDLLNGQGQ